MKEQLTTESHSSWAWKAPLKIIQSQALLRAGSAKPGCQGHVHSGSEPHQWWSLHHIWTACSGAWLPSQCKQKKRIFFLLRSEALPLALPLTTPRGVCLLYIEKIPKTFSSLHCAVPACSASPHSTGTPNTWWLWWPLAGLPAEHPCLQLKSSELDTALQRRPRPAGKALPKAAPEAVGSKSTVLAHGQRGAHQDPLNLLHKSASQWLDPVASGQANWVCFILKCNTKTITG